MDKKYKTDEKRLHELNLWFRNNSLTLDQSTRCFNNRKAAKDFALLLCNNCPPSADLTAALRLLRECLMTANASIACEEIEM